MKRRSLHHQIQQLFLASGIVQPGTSAYKAGMTARRKGITSLHDLVDEYMIYSFHTAEEYLEVWRQFANYLRTHGLSRVSDIAPEHVTAYLTRIMEEKVGCRAFAVHVAALKKLGEVLRMTGQAKNFRGVTDDMVRKASAALLRNRRPQAYEYPPSLIDAIGHGPSRLVARVQLEGGARVSEATLIKKIQLCGQADDLITGQLKGKIHLIHTKGGFERDILVGLKTYRGLEEAVATDGVFRANEELYKRCLLRAAVRSYQAYQGAHGFRWNFAQRRYLLCRDNGLPKEKALLTVSKEMGHSQTSATIRYLFPRV